MPPDAADDPEEPALIVPAAVVPAQIRPVGAVEAAAPPATQIEGVPQDNSPGVSARERFQGELTLRATVLRMITVVLVGLLVLGLFVLYRRPDSFDEYVNRCFPIISGVVFGIVGFAVGKESK
jgi:hypothetical protein